MTLRSTAWQTSLVGTLVVAGCGGHQASVSGTVKLDGKPLDTGTVSFYPEGGQGTPAYGTIDAQGRYTLSTGTQAGLAPGKYVALVVATKERPPANPGEPELPPELLTPAKYGAVESSDLRCEVKAGNNEFPLELTSN